MEKGVFTIGSISAGRLFQAVDLAVSMYQNGDKACVVSSYTENNVSGKVVKILQSYVEIINQIIWRK